MDVDGVRLYLIDNVRELNFLHDKILNSLRCATDPGKLVLDVFKTVHQQFAYKPQFEAIKTSSILLELLMELSPPITPELKNEAIDYAYFLKPKVKENYSPNDHMVYFKLLAAFKLARLYNANELLSLFTIFYKDKDVVYRTEENSYLCRVLGLSRKIPGKIIYLIRRLTYSNLKFAILLPASISNQGYCYLTGNST